MNREKYRRFLVVVFTVYVFFFIYYLSYTIYTHASGESQTVANIENKREILNRIKTDGKRFMPLGMPVGIYIHSKGIMVLDTGEVTGMDGEKIEPTKNSLKSGDYITCFNGEEIDSIKGFTKMIQQNGEKQCVLTVLRDGRETTIEMTPIQTESKAYKLGIWVRQDAQGIGTLTFVDENGHFVALGHGITDVDTGEIIDIQYGRLYESKIMSIIKGKNGEPGEMIGHIDYIHSPVLGIVESNNAKGIYGKLAKNVNLYDEEQAISIAEKHEVKEGEAWIRCSIDGEIKDYEIQIEHIEKLNLDGQKNFMIRVMDEELMKKTNGIVQGMSGSPIIQDGKLVGAVTHVLVNDPTRGYGIFIENMLEAAK